MKADQLIRTEFVFNQRYQQTARIDTVRNSAGQIEARVSYVK